MADALTSTVNRRNALIRWDKVADRRGATQAMRDGFLAKLRAQVLDEHPGLTDEAEIEARVQRKLRIHRETMRANSLRTRRANAAARQAAANEALADAILAGDE